MDWFDNHNILLGNYTASVVSQSNWHHGKLLLIAMLGKQIVPHDILVGMEHYF